MKRTVKNGLIETVHQNLGQASNKGTTVLHVYKPLKSLRKSKAFVYVRRARRIAHQRNWVDCGGQTGDLEVQVLGNSGKASKKEQSLVFVHKQNSSVKMDIHNQVSFFHPKTEQNHQQPDQSFPVELIRIHQQGCHFCAAPT